MIVPARTNLILFIIAVLSLVFLYLGHADLDLQQKRLDKLNARIQETRDNIAVLEAEWVYLSRPDRVSQLSKQLLGLTMIDPARIGSSDKVLALLVKPLLVDTPPQLTQNARAAQ